METIPVPFDPIMDTLIKQQKELTEQYKSWESEKATLLPIVQKLHLLDIKPSYGNTLEISFTGDSAKLREVLTLLEQAGYSTDSEPPVLGTNSWYAYFNHSKYTRVWLYFSSSVCNRVQVGTKTVEVPIYEYQCGEFETTTEAIIDTLALEQKL